MELLWSPYHRYLLSHSEVVICSSSSPCLFRLLHSVYSLWMVKGKESQKASETLRVSDTLLPFTVFLRFSLCSNQSLFLPNSRWGPAWSFLPNAQWKLSFLSFLLCGCLPVSHLQPWVLSVKHKFLKGHLPSPLPVCSQRLKQSLSAFLRFRTVLDCSLCISKCKP